MKTLDQMLEEIEATEGLATLEEARAIVEVLGGNPDVITDDQFGPSRMIHYCVMLMAKRIEELEK